MGTGDEDPAMADAVDIVGVSVVAGRSIISTSLDDGTALLGRTGIDFGDTAGEESAEVAFKEEEVI